MRTAILINYDAHNGMAKNKWMKIKDRVMEFLPSESIIIPYQGNYDLHGCMENLIKDENIEFIISAGGDGSIHRIINHLVSIYGFNLKHFHLGAIGLGSSNDFLKPFTNHIDDVAVKINTTNSVLSDIGRVCFINCEGKPESKVFIVNAGIGVVAEANYFFNHGDRFFEYLKKRFVKLAILYAATKTIMGYENKIIRITTPNEQVNQVVANISVTKNPNISGKFCYDQQTTPDSGLLGLHTIGDVSHYDLLKILWDLSGKKFSGKKNRSTTFNSFIEIETDNLLLFETDGEVQLGKQFQFDVIHKAIKLAK